jgi:proline dehydrogenase
MSNVPVISFLAYQIAKNWIAGKSIKEAIKYSKRANARGFSAVVNYLGEEIREATEVQKTTEEYHRLLNSMRAEGIDGSISVKLTQLGLGLDKEYCRKNLEEIQSFAAKIERFVWIDMESSRFTDDTIDLYSSSISVTGNVGICIQSHLRRSERDLQKLIQVGGKIRLVKGAYNEPEAIAYKSKYEISRNFSNLMEHLFANSPNMFSIATHDSKLVNEALELSEKQDKNFEFAMLKGIRDNLKLELVSKGYRVTEYIPYGENWLPYSLRRMREKPSNILLLARSLVNK